MILHHSSYSNHAFLRVRRYPTVSGFRTSVPAGSAGISQARTITSSVNCSSSRHGAYVRSLQMLLGAALLGGSSRLSSILSVYVKLIPTLCMVRVDRSGSANPMCADALRKPDRHLLRSLVIFEMTINDKCNQAPPSQSEMALIKHRSPIPPGILSQRPGDVGRQKCSPFTVGED